MIEIEKGRDFSFIYVPRTKENRQLLKTLCRMKNPTADYWPSWNEHCKTYFTTDMMTYKKDNCIGHSWTFNSEIMAERLEKLVKHLPFVYQTEQ